MDKVAVGSKTESQRQPYSVEQVTMILNRVQHESDDIFLPPVEPESRRITARGCALRCPKLSKSSPPAAAPRWSEEVALAGARQL
jgi:hypothetical protein